MNDTVAGEIKTVQRAIVASRLKKDSVRTESIARRRNWRKFITRITSRFVEYIFSLFLLPPLAGGSVFFLRLGNSLSIHSIHTFFPWPVLLRVYGVSVCLCTNVRVYLNSFRVSDVFCVKTGQKNGRNLFTHYDTYEIHVYTYACLCIPRCICMPVKNGLCASQSSTANFV